MVRVLAAALAFRIAPTRKVVAFNAVVVTVVSQTPFCPEGTAQVVLAVVVGLLFTSRETVKHAFAGPPVGHVSTAFTEVILGRSR